MPLTAPEAMVSRWGTLKTLFRDVSATPLEIPPSAVGNTIVVTFLRLQADGVDPLRAVTITGPEAPVVLRMYTGKELSLGGGEAIIIGEAGEDLIFDSAHGTDQTYCEVLVSYYEIPA